MCSVQHSCKTWLNVNCAAACVDSPLPDQSHAHVSQDEVSEQPSVSPGAVHHLQSDCEYKCRFNTHGLKG